MKAATSARSAGGQRHVHKWWRGRRRWMLLSLTAFWMALLSLALPFTVYGDSNNLAEYSALATAWGFQPFIENDFFQNAPATDQATPLVKVSMDSTPGAKAHAAYFFPGTAGNAVLIQQGQPPAFPDGVEADYPGPGSASETLQSFSDPNNFNQAGAGIQSATASEGYAKAQAALAKYQFMPTSPTPPIGGTPPLPTVGLPTPGVGTSPTPGTSGSPAPTSTPGAAAPTPTQTPKPTPTPTPICIIVCLSSAHADASSSHPSSAQAPAAHAPTPPQLPDVIEQQLVTALRAAETAHPTLVKLAGGHMAATDATLPYASADLAAAAETRATSDGVTIAMYTHATNVQIFQGLITFASVETTAQAVAPATPQTKGDGTLATHIADATIAGIPVTIDAAGVHVSTQGVDPSQAGPLSDALKTALQAAGVDIETAENLTTHDVGFWSGRGGGIDITASATPGNAVSQAGVITATHVEISLARIDAHIYALGPSSAAGSGGGGFGGGGYGGGGGGGGICFFCGGSGGSGDTGSGNAPSAPQSPGSQLLSIPGGLSGQQILALAFVVQGISTAAVAAAGGYVDAAAKTSVPPVEEETQ